MKYFVRLIYVINGKHLDMPKAEIYRINSKGVICGLSNTWGNMFWVRCNVSIEYIQKYFKECTFKDVAEYFENYELY